MSYDYKEDVVGSLVRCHVCGKAKTRGESCTACQQRMDAVEGTIKMFAEKDSELVRLRAELAAANEKCAELAAALERALKLGREIAGFVKSYGLDDVGPQSEWSRYIQCRDGLDNSADPAAVLRTVRQQAAAWELRKNADELEPFALLARNAQVADALRSVVITMREKADAIERGDVEVPNERLR